MSNVDGDFSPEEKNIIDAHCIEMHIDNNNYEIDTRQDEVLNQLQESLTEQERSIFFLELVGTVMADDVYHDSEKELIGKLAQILQKECDAYMRFLKAGNSAPSFGITCNCRCGSS